MEVNLTSVIVRKRVILQMDWFFALQMFFIGVVLIISKEVFVLSNLVLIMAH